MAILKKRPGSEGAAQLTESTAQSALYKWCASKNHELVVPNCGMAFGWESDLVSVTKAGIAHEFEIKVSRSDWLAELRATRDGKPGQNPKASRALMLAGAAEIAGQLSKGGKAKLSNDPTGFSYYTSEAPPNYWWLATAEDVAKPEEVPEYAGHVVIIPGTHIRYQFHIEKQAPKLHGRKISDRQWRSLARGACLRYWQIREEDG